MNVLDLFSGIGGFSLGLERAGFHTLAFCEVDPWCRRVLAKHWPGVPCYADVRELDAPRLRADGIGAVDLVAGGFPCQDISAAGKGAGLDGERSGLWREFHRIIGDVRPRFALVENVGALRARGLARILGDLASIGYDAEWHAIPAAAIGAPHLRDRVWIVAFDASDSEHVRRRRVDPAAWDGSELAGSAAADADSQRLRQQSERAPSGRIDVQSGGETQSFDDGAPRTHSDADGRRRERERQSQHGEQQCASGPQCHRLGARGRRGGSPAPDAAGRGSSELRGLFGPLARALAAAATPWDRPAESPLRRMDDGIPARLDRPRLKALGNAVVPQLVEIIGRAILEEANA